MPDPKNIADPTGKPRRLSKQALAKSGKSRRRTLQRVEVRERRYKVREMRLQGFNVGEIAEKLGHDSGTVRKDLAVIREEQVASAKDIDRDHHVVEAGERFDMLYQKAWEVFDEAKPGSQAKIKALDLIRLVQGDTTKALVETGAIAKEEKAVEIKHTHTLEWDDSMRDRVAKALVDQSLKTPLLEPTPEEDIIDAEYTETETEKSDDPDEGV